EQYSITTRHDYLVVTLTVSDAVLTNKINNFTRTYGDANPLLTGRITGIQNGDNITASYTTVATAGSTVGIYPIKATLIDPDRKLSDYNLIVQDGTLTITRAALTVTADDKARMFAADNPPLTGTLAGVRNGDNITARYTTTANRTSLPGNYPITPGLNDPDNRLGNYTVSVTNGTLTVTLLPLSTSLLSVSV